MAFLGGRSDSSLQECWGAPGTRGPRSCDGQRAGGSGDTPGLQGGGTHGVSSPGGEGSTPRPLGLGARGVQPGWRPRQGQGGAAAERRSSVPHGRASEAGLQFCTSPTAGRKWQTLKGLDFLSLTKGSQGEPGGSREQGSPFSFHPAQRQM